MTLSGENNTSASLTQGKTPVPVYCWRRRHDTGASEPGSVSWCSVVCEESRVVSRSLRHFNLNHGFLFTRTFSTCRETHAVCLLCIYIFFINKRSPSLTVLILASGLFLRLLHIPLCSAAASLTVSLLQCGCRACRSCFPKHPQDSAVCRYHFWMEQVEPKQYICESGG